MWKLFHWQVEMWLNCKVVRRTFASHKVKLQLTNSMTWLSTQVIGSTFIVVDIQSWSLTNQASMSKLSMFSSVDNWLCICRVIRPLSSVGKSVISSVEEIVLGSSCEGYICPLQTMSAWDISLLYPNDSRWILSRWEMVNYTEGWESSTLIVSPHLLLQLPAETQLVACMTVVDAPTSESKLCKAFNVIMPEKCDSCFLKAPNVIDEFQPLCIICNCSLKSDDSFELYGRSFSSPNYIWPIQLSHNQDCKPYHSAINRQFAVSFLTQVALLHHVSKVVRDPMFT